MKKIFGFIILLFSFLNVKAQSNMPATFLFKLWLYVDKKNGDGSLKNDSLFIDFNKVVELKLDTIEYNLYDLDFNFYFLKLYDLANNNFTRNLSYNRKISSSEIKDYFIPVGKFIGHYAIAVNSKTGKSYRLAGFNGNDFLGFLSDIKEEYKRKHYRPLSTKKFLNEFHIRGLDFNCLFEGLKSEELDREKYPCLIRCSDPIGIK